MHHVLSFQEPENVMKSRILMMYVPLTSTHGTLVIQPQVFHAFLQRFYLLIYIMYCISKLQDICSSENTKPWNVLVVILSLMAYLFVLF